MNRSKERRKSESNQYLVWFALNSSRYTKFLKKLSRQVGPNTLENSPQFLCGWRQPHRVMVLGSTYSCSFGPEHWQVAVLTTDTSAGHNKVFN